jgi:integrase
VADPERPRYVFGPYPRELRGRTTWRVITERESGARDLVSFDIEDEATTAADAARRAINKVSDERSIADAVAAYLAAAERRVTEGEIRRSTVEREEAHLHKMLQVDKHGMLDIRRLSPQLAEQLYDERTGAVDTHRNGLAVCKAFGVWCVKRKWLKSNPFAEVKGRGRRKKGKKQLRIEESRTVIDVCAERLGFDDGAVCTLAYLLLSTRNGEVVLADVRDVDDAGRMFWVPDSKTEAGRRQIEVPAVLQAGLLRLAADRKPDEPLFAHASTRARPQDWAREQVWRICKLARVPTVGPHGLRGTHATIANSAGATSELVAATLGHASTGITTGGAYIDKRQAEAAARRRAWSVLDGGRAAGGGR